MNAFSKSSDNMYSILFPEYTSVFIEGTNYDYIRGILNNELEKVNI